MTVQGLVGGGLGLGGLVSLAYAIVHERRMHAHRHQHVSYRAATLRRDGGWRRDDLFTAEGLAHQRHASRWGITGSFLLLAALLAWVALGSR